MDAEAAALAAAEAACLEAQQQQHQRPQFETSSQQPSAAVATAPAHHQHPHHIHHHPMDVNVDAGMYRNEANMKPPAASQSQMQEAELFQRLMMSMSDDESKAQLLHLLQQEKQQQEQEAMRRPGGHHLTISKEGTGTILEATNTVTGFPPDALLMNSSYDLIYDEDLPGFLCIKTHFWDEGVSNVPVVIRRRTMDGSWVWLSSRAVAYVTDPVPGITLEETVIQDVETAQKWNRITRITAVVVQAVEAAWLAESQAKEDNTAEPSHTAMSTDPIVQRSSVLSEDVQAYQALMHSMAASGETIASDALQNLIQIAAVGGDTGLNNPTASQLQQEIIERQQNKSFDPFCMIESVRSGVRLDLGLTRLYPDEVKLITAVLIGLVPVAEVVPAVLAAVESDEGLEELASNITLDWDTRGNTRGSSSMYAQYPSGDTQSSGSLASHSGSPKVKRKSPGADYAIPSPVQTSPPPISVVNLSYTYIGNTGIDMLSEMLFRDTASLQSLDVSFCDIEERGLIALSRGFMKRKKNGLPYLRGVILSGNHMTPRAATEIGIGLSPATAASHRRRRARPSRSGSESDSSESEDEDDEDYERRRSHRGAKKEEAQCCVKDKGLQVLHVSSASLTSSALACLLEGLGMHCPVRELNISSNDFGPSGVTDLIKFLETQQRSVNHKAMPFLDRLDMSNNNLGDDGTARLTKAIASKRSNVHIVDLKLSSNSIGSGGIETIMNKLLTKHNLLSLSLDKNAIGDQGCQLVAASLQSMRSLSRLNLSFNQIGSRGINSLMRSLIVCESITYLGLSGNILRITGAIALAFSLAQHPRLEEVDLDNCCLGQAAQCHIAAGVISNRWVPMKRMKGYAVGPPMVAIGALKPFAATLSNEECFRIRKDEQMKTILQWTEENRIARRNGSAVDPAILAAAGLSPDADYQQTRFLTPEFVATINNVHGLGSHNAYFRLLGWLGFIPFDEDELTALQKYFYDADGGDGDRGSDGGIDLKLRGDLLAALDSEVADGFRDEFPSLAAAYKGSVGIDLEKVSRTDGWNAWEAFKGNTSEPPPRPCETGNDVAEAMGKEAMDTEETIDRFGGPQTSKPASKMRHAESTSSIPGKVKKPRQPHITMFPQFELQLEELKAAATEMIEQEDDPMQHDVILTQYAEASLTILRQLRYHCMNSGLDGWRKGGLKRKVLIVDDSNVTRKFLSHHFLSADFIVDTAANGAEGVEKLKASIYDIAFMDIDMPVMNGFDATKKLREWEDTMRPGARQPICALTATYVDNFEREELMKFKEAGLDVMESKPPNIPRLFKVVDDVSPMFSDLTLRHHGERLSDSFSEASMSSGFH